MSASLNDSRLQTRYIHPASQPLIELFHFLDNKRGKHFSDWEYFLGTEASLMALNMLGDEVYEMGVTSEADIPPHILEFDCQGAITILEGSDLIEGAEIKISSNGMILSPPQKQIKIVYYIVNYNPEFGGAEKLLTARFLLLSYILPILFSGIMKAEAEGYAFASYSRLTDKNKPGLEQKNFIKDPGGILEYKMTRRIVRAYC